MRIYRDIPGRFYTDSVDLLFENNIKKMIKSNQFDFEVMPLCYLITSGVSLSSKIFELFLDVKIFKFSS